MSEKKKKLNEKVNENEKIDEVKETKEKGNSKVFTIVIILLTIVILALGILYASGVINNYESASSESIESTEEVIKNYDEEVKVDASLATQPLTDAFKEKLNNFNITNDYSNTDPAYTKLINKEVDLIVVTEPSAEEKQRAADAGVELVVTPVVNEGFVFYTNVENNVKNISLDNIRKIYTGEITNWKDLGGEDANIIAYQRPVNSGSQTGILSLVMNGLKMKEPTKEEYIETMAGIIDAVANYDNSKNSIGYSYYYYATTMYSNDKLKFFSIDNIEPNYETIKNKSYPLVTSYYIVTLKDNNREAVNALKNTMLSSKGQAIAKEAGYIEHGN